MIRAEPGRLGTHRTVAPASLTSLTASRSGVVGGVLPGTTRGRVARGAPEPAAIFNALLGGPRRPRVSTAATVIVWARPGLNLRT